MLGSPVNEAETSSRLWWLQKAFTVPDLGRCGVFFQAKGGRGSERRGEQTRKSSLTPILINGREQMIRAPKLASSHAQGWTWLPQLLPLGC